MNYLMIITSPPYGSSALHFALTLAQAIVQQDKLSVFFYGDGVFNVLATINPASDEYNPVVTIKELATKASFYYCQSAASRRGVMKEQALSCCVESSLAQLSQLMCEADRVISL